MVVMLIMLDSPIFSRKLDTTSSNLSWPTSTQSVCLIVLMRIFLSVVLAATSSGTRGFTIKLSVGDVRTGTRRCISTFAAADEAMALTGWTSSFSPPGTASTPGRLTTDSGFGMIIASPQDGQLISDPTPELSTASSCSHFGQLNMTSIGVFLFSDCGARIAPHPALG